MKGGSVFKTNNRTHQGRNPHIRLSSSTSQKPPTEVVVREPAPVRTRHQHGTKLLHIGETANATSLGGDRLCDRGLLEAASETGPHSKATRPTR